jgi:mono/diheme cytochrome c family protein
MRELACLCVWIAATTLLAEDAVIRVPFVSGFDRFGRHADIDAATAGRLLMTELSCAACHSSSDVMLNPKRGPVLDGAGNRLYPSWVRSFLLSPAASKPGTTMPNMLAGLPPEEREPAADAITAFLASLQQPFAEIKATGANPVPMEFWNRGNAENGRRLYHQIGCVACHEPDNEYDVTIVKPSPLDEMLEQLNPDELKEMGLTSAARRVKSVPHAVLPAKFTSQSLTYFLLNPEHTHPTGRMPNFALTAVDAADIAAWLLRNQGKPELPSNLSEKPDASMIAKGRRLFSELNCAACHTIQGIDAPRPAKPIAAMDLTPKQQCCHTEIDSGNLRQKGQPRWAIDETQNLALNTALVSIREPALGNKTDELTFHLLQQNCYACHERSQLGGIGRFRKPYFETVGHVDIGDEGRLPPTLTGVGKKLTTSWMGKVLTGKGIVRPFMTIRMPVFPGSATKPLAALFANTDVGTTKPADESNVFAQADRKTLVEAGRQLMDTGCVQCHAFKGEALPGTVGVELEGATDRIHPNWLHDFLKDPGSLKARTRMPTFFPNGQSQNQDVFSGDMELQISAMHAYLKGLSKEPLPDKIQQARNQNYELVPVDRPILLRTFMSVAGMHAIAVGFPQHVHFAFDAERITLTQAWRGRFLDAEGTWFVRFAPPADPLGDHIARFPPSISIASLDEMTSRWPDDAASAGAKFSGYRLDKTGVPVFLYTVHGFDITDRIEPDEEGGLRRTIAVQTNADSIAEKPLWLRAHAGKTLTKKSPQTFVDETGLTVIVDKPKNTGEIRTVKDLTEWIIPVSGGGQRAIEIHYRW